MKKILILLLSLFVVSCSTVSYVEYEPNRINYFSSCPVINPTLNIVYTTGWPTHNHWYNYNIYTNHWPYTNNVYSNDYYGYYSNYTHYYLPYYYYPHYTPHFYNWNNHHYQYSNGHHRVVNSAPVYNTPRSYTPRPNYSPRPTYNTPRSYTPNYNSPRPSYSGGVRTMSGGRR